MNDIFAQLYKKVLNFFQTKEETEENTKNVACNRLKLVLMQDRTNLTPYLLERMRGEMIDVLSKYLEMDKEALELNFEAEGESMALMLSIPVVRAKEEDEINAILEAEDKAKEEEASEDENSDEKVGEEETETKEEAEIEKEAEEFSEEIEEALETEEKEIEDGESAEEKNTEEPKITKKKKIKKEETSENEA
jgi:cell division topological specificity factor